MGTIIKVMNIQQNYRNSYYQWPKFMLSLLKMRFCCILSPVAYIAKDLKTFSLMSCFVAVSSEALELCVRLSTRFLLLKSFLTLSAQAFLVILSPGGGGGVFGTTLCNSFI